MPNLVKIEPPAGHYAIPKASPGEEDWCDNQFLCLHRDPQYFHNGRYFISGIYLAGGDLVVRTPGRKFDEVPIGRLAEVYHIEPDINP